MERKAKMGMSALMIVAITFIIIGVSFLPIGIASFVFGWSVEGSLTVFSLIFGGMGLLFLVLGITFLSIEIKKRNTCNRLLQEGYYILAEVIEVDKNYNVSYGGNGRTGGRHPYIVKCGYTDENGTLHIFSSRNIKRYPGNELIGRQVRVYLDRNDYNSFKHYYVDVDEVLGNVVEH